jgi:MFS family permease
MKLNLPKSPHLNLWLTSATIFLFWISLYVYVPVLPVYAEKVKGAPYQVVGLIIASYGFTQLLLRIPFGYGSDRSRRRKIFVVFGLLLSIASGLGLAAAAGPALLIVFRGLSGVAAATWAISTVWFASFFPPEAAVKAAGRASFLAGLGQVLATASGGSLAQSYGWQAPFLVAAAIAGVGLLPLLLVGETREVKEAFTAPGSLRQTLSDRTLLVVSLAAAAGQFVTFSTTFGFIPIYASDLGASQAQVGWLTSAAQGAYVITSLGVGFLAASRSEKNLALAGLAAIGAASFWAPAIHSVPLLFANRILHGLGNGLSYPVLMGLAIKGVPGERRALAMGAFQAIYALGMFAGPTLSGFMARASGVPSVFLSSGVLILLSLPFLMWGLKPAGKVKAAVPEMSSPQ